MNKEQQINSELRQDTAVREKDASGIGTGKKVGLYGCGFLILAVIIIAAILIFTGMYVPFEGTEGVGP